MVALFQVFMDVLGIMFTFVQTYLIPPTASDVNVIHVAVWTPITLGILGGVIAFFKKLWGGNKK